MKLNLKSGLRLFEENMAYLATVLKNRRLKGAIPKKAIPQYFILSCVVKKWLINRRLLIYFFINKRNVLNKTLIRVLHKVSLIWD